MSRLSKFALSESLLVALIPIFGYSAAYFYQIGRFQLFKVPTDFIQIGIEKVIVASFITLLLSLVGYLIYLFIKVIFSTKEKKKNNSLNGFLIVKDTLAGNLAIAILIPPLIAILIFFTTTLDITITMGIYLMILIFIIGVGFLPPLFKYPDTKSYKRKFDKYQDYVYQNKIEQVKKEENKNFSISLIPFADDHPFFNYSVIVIVLLFWSFISFLSGSANATEIHPIVVVNEKEYILFGSYNNQHILVGVDVKTKKTNSEIMLISDGENIIVKMKRIGIINKAEPSSYQWINLRRL